MKFEKKWVEDNSNDKFSPAGLVLAGAFSV